MTLHFFSPHQQYAQGEAFAEFRAMVQAFHAAGIEVWLDVVYNHTAEGDQNGPTYSFRGIDNDSYYLLTPDLRHYVNDTGCGNTVRTGHPAGRVLVLESLRFWARNMGVDGFRFDLASIFSRAADGTMGMHEASLVSEIGLLARLFNVRLVAEAWDISSYQLGRGFPGMAWLQWNGQFRDDVRSFVRGEPGKVGALMQRLYGSDDLFPDALQDTRRPHQSVNFLTAHDGFCLYDLVAYDQKHNEANGHGNTDGTNDNLSWNCGWEGDEDAPDEVLALRRQQAKNFCALLLLSNGIPMIVAGDEFLNTPAREQQSLQPGQRDHLARLGAPRTEPRRLPLLQAHDRVSQGAPVHRARDVLARRREVVWTRRAGGFRSRVPLPGLLPRRRIRRRRRPLRDDQRPLGGPAFHRAGRRAVRMAARRGHGEAQPGGHRRAGEGTQLESASYPVRARSVVVLRKEHEPDARARCAARPVSESSRSGRTRLHQTVKDTHTMKKSLPKSGRRISSSALNKAHQHPQRPVHRERPA